MLRIGRAIICSLLLLPYLAQAAKIVETHVGEVKVANFKDPQRAAFEQVLIKMSGNKQATENEFIRQTLSQSATYLNSYAYFESKNEQFYRAEFDQNKVSTLLQQARLSLWGSLRPESILWLAEKPYGNETISILTDASSSAIRSAVMEASKNRGVPALLPIYDLDDAMLVAPIDVWARFMPVLNQASERYNVENIIAARIQSTAALRQQYQIADRLLSQKSEDEQPNDPMDEGFLLADDYQDDLESDYGFDANEFAIDEQVEKYQFVLDWSIHGENLSYTGRLFADDKQALVENLIDSYADILASQFALQAGVDTGESLQLNIANVTSLESMVSLVRYLQDLTIVQSAMLTGVKGNLAFFKVNLLGEKIDLKAVLELDKKLVPINATELETVKQIDSAIDEFAEIEDVVHLYWNF